MPISLARILTAHIGFMRSMAPTPLPTRPPFTAHIGNLPYDATMEAVEEFFEGCGVSSVRIIEDRELQRPKGFAYVEFHELDGLKRALDFDNSPLNGRYVKVKVADPREFPPTSRKATCFPPLTTFIDGVWRGET